MVPHITTIQKKIYITRYFKLLLEKNEIVGPYKKLFQMVSFLNLI